MTRPGTCGMPVMYYKSLYWRLQIIVWSCSRVVVIPCIRVLVWSCGRMVVVVIMKMEVLHMWVMIDYRRVWMIMFMNMSIKKRPGMEMAMRFIPVRMTELHPQQSPATYPNEQNSDNCLAVF